MSAARVEAGEVAWLGSFGFADFEARRLVTHDTPFMLASISKTFVAVTLAKLGETHDLDAPIDDAFGRAMRSEAHPDRAVTARQLVSHRSGLIDDWIALGAASSEGDYPGTLDEFTRAYWTEAHLRHEPGAVRDYTNAGFGVLGAWMERRSGETLPALTRAAVLEPLGLASAGWHLAELDVDALAVPYLGELNGGVTRGKHEGYGFYPATSLRVSARDLARFLATLTRRGLTPEGARLYSEQIASTLEAIVDPAVDADQAFGLYFEELGGRRVLGHTGSALGFSALMFFDPATGDGALLLTNSDAFVRGRLTDRAASKVLYEMTAEILDAAP